MSMLDMVFVSLRPRDPGNQGGEQFASFCPLYGGRVNTTVLIFLVWIEWRGLTPRVTHAGCSLRSSLSRAGRPFAKFKAQSHSIRS